MRGIKGVIVGWDEREFKLSSDLFDKLSRLCGPRKLEDLFTVQVVAKNPAYVFEGLRTLDGALAELLKDKREFVSEPDKDGICICGAPANRRLLEGVVPAPAGMTFAVWVNGSGYIMGWDWMKAADDGVRPIGYEDRFGRQLWPTV